MSAPPSALTSLSLDSSSVPLPVVVDPASLALLKGATLDFTTELIGSAFRVRENPQAKGAGCGCGVSWEAK
jgi:Fe-S cluster assembly iron-binding protein IscA